jgi:hypothetical protein
MENPEIKSSSEPTAKQLQEQVDSLRHIVVSLLVLTIVISGTFTLFLLRQSKYARVEANNLRSAINEYNNTNFPVIRDFRDRLAEYSKSHRDFASVAQKYGLELGPGSVTPQAPAAVAPASGASPAGAPKQKK